MRRTILFCVSLACVTVACSSTTKNNDDVSGDGGSGGSGGKGGNGGSGGKGGSAGSGISNGGTGQGGNAQGGQGQAGSGGSAAGAGGTKVDLSAPKVYDFENDANGWSLALESRDMPQVALPDAGTSDASDAGVVTLKEPVQSKDKALTGTGSLRVDLQGTAGFTTRMFVGLQGSPGDIAFVRPITKVTLNLWVPLDAALSYTQAYLVGFGEGQGGWQSASKTPTPGAWTTYEIILAVPYALSPYGMALGFGLETKTAWKGSVYIDDVKVEFQAL